MAKRGDSGRNSYHQDGEKPVFLSMNFRIKSIEGCRGLATILIMFVHFAVMFYPAVYWGPEYTHWQNGLDYLLWQIVPFPSGHSGVMLFLLITSFGTYIAVNGDKIDIRKYLLLRYFKLLLLTLLGVLPIIILLQSNMIFVTYILSNLNTPWFGNWSPGEINFWQALLHNPLSSLAAYNGVLWTMPYFFWGMILSFIMAKCFSKNFQENLYFSLGVFLLLANMAQYYYMVCVTGTFLAYCYKYHTAKFQVSALKRVILFALAWYLCSYPAGIVGKEGIFLHHSFQQAYILYHTAGATLLAALALMQNSLLQKAMKSRIFQWLGRYSMGIYLIHYPLLISLMAYLYRQLPEFLSYQVKTLLLLLVYIICVLAAGVPIQAAGNYLFRLMDKLYKYIFRRCCSE